MFRRLLSRAALLSAALLLGITPQIAPAANPTPAYDDYSRQVMLDGPAGYWRLNDAAGSTTVNDISGSGLNASVGANVALGQPSVLAHEIATQAQFQTNTSAPVLPAAADVIQTPASALLQPTAALTLEALVTMPSVFANGNYNFVIAGQGWKNSSPYQNYGISCHVTSGVPGICQPRGDVNSTTIDQFGGIAGITAGATVHMALTYNGSNVILYVNGFPVGSAALTGAVTYPSVIPLVIGGADVANTNSGYEFPGKVSEVAVYPTALTQARLLAHANAARGLQTYTATQLATTTTPGTTTGNYHQLAWIDGNQITNQANYTPAQWANVAKHVDVSDRTFYNSAAINGQVGHGIFIGSYLDTSRSQTNNTSYTCTQGGAACAPNLTPKSLLRTCDGLSPVYWNGTADGHNTVNDYTSPTLATDINNLFANPFAVMRGNFVFADNVILPDEMATFGGGLIKDNSLTGPSVITYNQGLGFPANLNSPTCVANPLAPAISNSLLPPTLYNRATWIQGIAQTFQRLSLPVTFNYLSAYTDVGNILFQVPNVFGAWKENLFGFQAGNPQKNGHPVWDSGVNLFLQAAHFNRQFNDQEHTYGYNATNDVQGYMLASEAMGYQDGLGSIQMDGTTSGGWGGVTSPIQNMVFTNPEIPDSQIRSVSDLLVGNVYARRFRDVYLNGVSVGACVAMVNPDINNPATVPTFNTTYTQSVTVNNYVSSGVTKGAATELGDTGTISEATTTYPTTLPARGWSINCQ